MCSLLIGGGLVAAVALIGGVVLLTGGDDDKKSTVTLAPITSSSDVTATTAGITVPVITLAPTVPGTNAPPTSAESGLIDVFDDTGAFSILLPNDLETDTTTITSTDGFEIPSVSAATAIVSYNSDDVTFGLTAVAVGSDIGSSAEQVMAFLEPAEGTCTSRSVEIGRPTTHGAANVVSLSGCGVGGGNKVLMVVQLADRPVVLGIYMQGLAAIADLDPAAQLALESILVY